MFRRAAGRDRNLVPSGPLCRVEGLIGFVQQFIGADVHAVGAGDPTGEGDRQSGRGVRDEPGAEPFGDGERLGWRAAGQENDELFPAEPVDGVEAAEFATQLIGHGAQDMIAGVVTIGVVDLLEWSRSHMMTLTQASSTRACSVAWANLERNASRFANPVSGSIAAVLRDSSSAESRAVTAAMRLMRRTPQLRTATQPGARGGSGSNAATPVAASAHSTVRATPTRSTRAGKRAASMTVGTVSQPSRGLRAPPVPAAAAVSTISSRPMETALSSSGRRRWAFMRSSPARMTPAAATPASSHQPSQGAAIAAQPPSAAPWMWRAVATRPFISMRRSRSSGVGHSQLRWPCAAGKEFGTPCAGPRSGGVMGPA